MAKNKLSKAEAYFVAENFYEEYSFLNDGGACYTHSLCRWLPSKMRDDWENNWNIVNRSKTKVYISQYYSNSTQRYELSGLLRLLSLCMFIEDTYK